MKLYIYIFILMSVFHFVVNKSIIENVKEDIYVSVETLKSANGQINGKINLVL